MNYPARTFYPWSLCFSSACTFSSLSLRTSLGGSSLGGPAAFALAVPSTSSIFLLLCTRGSQVMTRCVRNSLRILRYLQSKERVRNYPCHQSGTRIAGPKASLNRLTRQRKRSSYMWEHMQQDTETCNSLSISDCNPFATPSTLLKKPESCAMARCRSNYLGQHARCPEQ
jgi:hypothetical protein